MPAVIDICRVYHEEVRQAKENEQEATRATDPDDRHQLLAWAKQHWENARLIRAVMGDTFRK